MSVILRVRDKNGKIIDIPAITGRTPIKGADYWTPEDKSEIIQELATTITEEWTFTLNDGSVVKKKVAIG